jgi:hypothetical protein
LRVCRLHLSALQGALAQLTHDYPEDPERQAALLNQLPGASAQLANVLHRIEARQPS